MLTPEPSELQFTIQQPNCCEKFARRRGQEDRIFAGGKLRATGSKVKRAEKTGCKAVESPYSRLRFVELGLAKLTGNVGKSLISQYFTLVSSGTLLEMQLSPVQVARHNPPKRPTAKVLVAQWLLTQTGVPMSSSMPLRKAGFKCAEMWASLLSRRSSVYASPLTDVGPQIKTMLSCFAGNGTYRIIERLDCPL